MPGGCGGLECHADGMKKGEERGYAELKTPQLLSSQGAGRGSGHREVACHLVVYYKYDCRMKVEYCKQPCPPCIYVREL